MRPFLVILCIMKNLLINNFIKISLLVQRETKSLAALRLIHQLIDDLMPLQSIKANLYNIVWWQGLFKSGLSDAEPTLA